jgi:nitroreductase
MDVGLYDSIFRRKSVRKYNMDPLSQGTIDEISDYLETLEPLCPEIKVKFMFAEHGEIANLLPVRCPHYLLMFSETEDNYLYNVGFVGQQIDLYLSARGLGSCWLGLAKPHQEISGTEELDFVIMLGFGEAAEPLYREEVSQFKRKPLSQISSVLGAEELLEPVRLAPSAVNRQPWYFYGTPQKLYVAREKLNPVTYPIYNRLNQIDTGIGLCHLVLSAEHLGKSLSFQFGDDERQDPPPGYQYVVTASIEP